MHGNTQYDLIVSLGGNCMVANNLRYRGMRAFSLPFDWVYMQDTKPLKYLIEGFKDGFKNLCLFENLEKVQGNTVHKIIYKDIYSGYCFPNHFEGEVLTNDEYDRFYCKLRKRIDRLFEKIKESNAILFVLASELSFNETDILNLRRLLLSLYLEKKINFRIMIFNADNENEIILNDNIYIYKYTRKQNLYDFSKTNFEWSWLDDIKYNYKTHKTSIKLFSFHFRNLKYRLDFSWRKLK